MISSLAAARWLAPTCFALNIVAQMYALFSSARAKKGEEQDESHVASFSPQLLFLGGVFLSLQSLQVVWLWELWRAGSRRVKVVDHAMSDFHPFYCVANLLMALWNISRINELLTLSNFVVAVESTMLLYFVLGVLSPMNQRSTASLLTHLVAKTMAGVAVLQLIHGAFMGRFNHWMTFDIVVEVLKAMGLGSSAGPSDQ